MDLDSADVGAARGRRVERHVDEHLDELLELWRAGEQLPIAAKALGLPVAACRSAIARCATEDDRAARRAGLVRAGGAATSYTDRDIILAVSSAAAQLGRVPSRTQYAALARELECPSVTTVANRMGGWTNAVRAAGLNAASPRGGRSRRWTAEACWAAMRGVVAELRQIPTVDVYDRHRAGRSDLPCSATVRLRLGRWSTITAQLAAEHELANHGPATPDARHAATTADEPRLRENERGSGRGHSARMAALPSAAAIVARS